MKIFLCRLRSLQLRVDSSLSSLLYTWRCGCTCFFTRSIVKTMINDLSSVPIGDFENEIPPQFPQRGNFARTWGLPSHLPKGDVPCPHGALLTVFSTTQLEHSIAQCESCHHGFGDAYFFTVIFDFIGCFV
jgi:hypothetical protein